jgi:hypothetical protein
MSSFKRHPPTRQAPYQKATQGFQGLPAEDGWWTALPVSNRHLEVPVLKGSPWRKQPSSRKRRQEKASVLKVILRNPLCKQLSGETYYFRKNNRFWVERLPSLPKRGVLYRTDTPKKPMSSTENIDAFDPRLQDEDPARIRAVIRQYLGI